MKKIMFLGGSVQQIPAIQYAKKQGYYTILCDYLTENPGRFYADEFYCVSTTNKETILNIAKKTNVEGIVAYASDPAALTVAYVGNKLNLPSNPYESVLILSRKDLFRKFLKEHGFNCPDAESYKTVEEARKSLRKFKFPLMVKPIDSSGSKGVSRIDTIEELEYAFKYAKSNSKKKIVIIEDYIEMAHECMIGGDGFVIDGKLELCVFLNSYRNPDVDQFVPVGTSYPSFIEDKYLNQLRNEVQRVIDLLQIKMGALNLEMMFDKKGRLYIIEIGPRNGGNMIPILLEMVTGVDLVKATVEIALNKKDINIGYIPADVYYSTFVMHSSRKGKLKDIIFKDEIQGDIISKVFYKEIGEEVETFDGANKAIGIIFLKFSSFEELKKKMGNMNQYIDIQLE